jgi:hypothetical protein
VEEVTSVAALWWAVMALGLFHGVNPGMGWPLAVSAALMEQRPRALLSALILLAFGHFLAMAVVLLPFSLMISIAAWQREIQIGAGVLVALTGIYLLINRRHPRYLARVKPTRLALWSFLAAIAHGAGFMLVPIYLGLCNVEELDAGHRAATELIAQNFNTFLMVAVAHTAAMAVSGGLVAFGIYKWLGLKFLSKSWFNIDALWALSLVIVGAVGVWVAI